MKISKAIYEGCKRGPQLKQQFFDDKGGTCVVGALIVGSGLDHVHNYDVYSTIIKNFPELGKIYKNPESGNEESLFHLMVILNDSYGWSRERIAKWIEQNTEKTVEHKSLGKLQKLQAIPQKQERELVLA